MTTKIIVAAVIATLGACSDAGSTGNPNACITLCNKLNGCKSAMGSPPADCASACRYGGNLLPGLAPAPSCPNLASQQACIAAAVQKSCTDYLPAAAACPQCPALDGSACTADADCQKYQPAYRCDLGRPGGYCTAACQQADADCSAVGPEACVAGKAPSFDSQAPLTQKWCLLGCQSDVVCRIAEGYSCQRKDAMTGFGVCDAP